MKMKTILLTSLAIMLLGSAIQAQENHLSAVWTPDLGNGNYKNPIIDADYSDPDVCRAGDDYFMTSSSFNCIPGLPILHSKDMVNWTIVGHALTALEPEALFAKPQHGNGVWAPAIRYHNGEFYIYWGDPDFGIYMVKTKDPFGKWEKPVLVKKGKGLIDSCPLWDEDGNAFLVHAYAGSRAGYKSVLAVAPLSKDGTHVLDESRIVYDGHLTDPTIEGPKFYKRNGYYYIFAPAGGVPTGWQLALRSKSPYGPYERKVVLARGETSINGPHQGAWVNTPAGEDWFFHFQDKEAYGRVVHLQPMRWQDDWPIMGTNANKEGCGFPVLTYKKPNVGKSYPASTPMESDEFNDTQLGLQWQWHANYSANWYFCAANEGVLRLYSVPSVGNKSLWDSPNLLLQKTPTEAFTATAKVNFVPANFEGERAGIVCMGLSYATLYLQNNGANGISLVLAECADADKGGTEKIVAEKKVDISAPLYLQMRFTKGANVTFAYSLDGKRFETIGASFKAREGKWIGAKTGLYINRPINNNDGGWMDVDWYRIAK